MTCDMVGDVARELDDAFLCDLCLDGDFGMLAALVPGVDDFELGGDSMAASEGLFEGIGDVAGDTGVDVTGGAINGTVPVPAGSWLIEGDPGDAGEKETRSGDLEPGDVGTRPVCSGDLVPVGSLKAPKGSGIIFFSIR